MTDTPRRPAAKPKKPLSPKEMREARLAQNLRDNLRKRKAAARKLND